MCSHLVISEHIDILVGHVHLEGVDSLLVRNDGHLFPHFFAPPRNSAMEGVITAYFGIGPASPALVCLDETLVSWRYDKVNCVCVCVCVSVTVCVHKCHLLFLTDHGGPSSKCSSCSSVEIINRYSTHEGKLQVCVGINPT